MWGGSFREIRLRTLERDWSQAWGAASEKYEPEFYQEIGEKGSNAVIENMD